NVGIVEWPEHSHRRDHTNDHAPRPLTRPIGSGRPKLASDGVLMAEKLFAKMGIHNSHRLPRIKIVVCEDTAGEQLLAGNVEIARTHLLVIDDRPVAFLLVAILLSVDFDRAVIRKRHSQSIGECGSPKIRILL